MTTDPTCRPELSWWSWTWRYLLCLVTSAVAWWEIAGLQWREHRALFWLDVSLGVVAYLLVLLHRRRPMTVAVLTSVISAFSALAAGPAVLAAVSVATARVWWQIGTLAVLSLVSGQTIVQVQPTPRDDPYWLNLTINAIATIAVLSFGMYVGSRRELMATLHERAERAEAERDLRAVKARGDERARIAREMHDVLAHRISQVSMHAGALAFREDLSAGEMRASAAVVQRQANEALTELRAVLGVLRDPDTGELLDRPQPTWADVPALLEESRSHGLRIEYDVSLADAAMPDLVGRTVYRIVQEALTNVRKHAPGERVDVRISGGPDDGVHIEVANPLPAWAAEPGAPGAGLGLVGLAERAELRGGRLEHGRERGRFVLRGWIPWDA